MFLHSKNRTWCFDNFSETRQEQICFLVGLPPKKPKTVFFDDGGGGGSDMISVSSLLHFNITKSLVFSVISFCILGL